MNNEAEQSEIQNEVSNDDKIAFDYIKSKHFRVIKVNGAVGGITPRGDFVINLFNERPPIPLHVVHKILDGKPGPEIEDERVSREAVIREVEVCAMMDLRVAKSIAAWITKHLEDFEELLNQAEEIVEEQK